MKTIEDLPRKISLLGLSVSLDTIHAVRDFICTIAPNNLDRADQVVSYLLDLGPDQDAVIAAFLFAARIPLESHSAKILELFGSSPHRLLIFLWKVHGLKPDFERNDTEVLRQVILMMAQDVRVMLIRLADRLYEMHMLGSLSPDEQKQISQESLKIYAPVASRLGVYSMKWQLEDLAFAHLNPSQFSNISEQLQQFGRERRQALDMFQEQIMKFFHQKEIVCRLTSRTKSIYSIYRKMRRKSTDQISDLHDVFAIRMLLPTVMKDGKESTELLYSVLGMIHSKWAPIAGRFKDYVAVPKPNGYQSLHTTILTSIPEFKNQPVEIQIRSELMHREAEYGIASHWLYEDTRGASTGFEKNDLLNLVGQNADRDGDATDSAKSRLNHQVEWLRGLMRIHDIDDQGEHPVEDHHTADDLHNFDIDLFHDRIFVFTPNGEVKDLSSGSTPVDFAYSVHTDIGHRCAMARVNGSIVPLNSALKNGDIVEIVLKPKPNPRSEWLSFVKTVSARQKIKVWFKSQNRELSLREGRDLLNKHLRRLNKASLDDHMSILKVYDGKNLSVSDRQKVIEGLGNGSIPIQTVMKKLFSYEDLMQPLTPVPLKVISTSLPLENKVLLGGEAGLPVRMAQCCSPIEGVSIAGYITRQHASIHRLDCVHLQSCNPARILDAKWTTDKQTTQKYSVRVLVEAANRIGLIRDITGVIADMNINILDFSLRHQDEKFVIRSLLLEVEGYEQLDEILRRLEGITGVVQVMREESRDHQPIAGKSKKTGHSKKSEASD